GMDTLTVTLVGGGAEPVSQEFRISDDNFCVIPSPDPRTNTDPNNICNPPLIDEDSNNNGVLDAGEDLNGNGLLDVGIPNVPLNTEQTFTVHWDRGGTPERQQPIIVSATRGALTTTGTLTTNNNGETQFRISSDNAGPSTLTVSADVPGGPSTQITFDFAATMPTTIELQANPSTVNANTPGSSSEQSEIIAVVRDAEKNLVQGARVEFTLTDITGGQISPSSALTDNFGRASTVYTAGASSSSTNGVTVLATVVGSTVPAATVNLTVAQRGVFVTLGTGNTTREDATFTRYEVPYTLLVNDINGVAVAGAQVTLSIIPVSYGKGYRLFLAPTWRNSGSPTLNVDSMTGQITVDPHIFCPNEDNLTNNATNNANGILDPGEDLNGNNRLDPGNVATLEPGVVTTNINGFADFTLIYPQENAGWVGVALTARTVAAGSEDTDIATFVLDGIASDFDDPAVAPPGTPSPFGVVQDCANPG
ncbi:MAG: Ig-like domain-containing protein, partial [Pseudomonadota bacterium]